jgi:hypothetical protein
LSRLRLSGTRGQEPNVFREKCSTVLRTRPVAPQATIRLAVPSEDELDRLTA